MLSDIDALCSRWHVPRETAARLERYVDLLIAENQHQNLIARASEPHVIARHIADSLQLLPHLRAGSTIDIGSGAGLPGIVLGCASYQDFVLCEPRAKRADFLRRVIDELDAGDRVRIEARKVERLEERFANITARAVASLANLFAIAQPVANMDTRWILPKGRTALAELEEARRTWHGEFELIPSATDPDAMIVVAERVRRRLA